MRSSRHLALPALVGLLALASGAPALSGCDSNDPVTCEVSGDIEIEDTTPEGTDLGATLATNDCIALDYVGRLADGSGTFDEGRLSPFLATTQSSQTYRTASDLIPGFARGLGGLRVGESRRISVPPNLGYGTREIEDRDPDDEYVGIPACSVLEFEVTLVEIYQDPRRCAR